MRKIYVTTAQNVSFKSFEQVVEHLNMTDDDEMYVIGNICATSNVNDTYKYIQFFMQKRTSMKNLCNIHYLLGITDFYVMQYFLATAGEREDKIAYKNYIRKTNQNMEIEEFRKILGDAGLKFLTYCEPYKLINVRGIPHFLSYGSPYIKGENEDKNIPEIKRIERVLKTSPETEGTYCIRTMNGNLIDSILSEVSVSLEQYYKEDRIRVKVVSAKDKTSNVFMDIETKGMSEEDLRKYRKKQFENSEKKKEKLKIYDTGNVLYINTGGMNAGTDINSMAVLDLLNDTVTYYRN